MLLGHSMDKNATFATCVPRKLLNTSHGLFTFSWDHKAGQAALSTTWPRCVRGQLDAALECIPLDWQQRWELIPLAQPTPSAPVRPNTTWTVALATQTTSMKARPYSAQFYSPKQQRRDLDGWRSKASGKALRCLWPLWAVRGERL